MNETELRALVERMVADLMGQAPTPQVKAADYKPLEDAPATGTGESLPDITEVDLRKLYLVEHPQNGPAFLDLKAKTPARLGFGRAGARYKTETMLRMRADHAAAQDSVFSHVDEAFVKRNDLVFVQTLFVCNDEVLNLAYCNLSDHVSVFAAAFGDQNVLYVLVVIYFKIMIFLYNLAVRSG